MLDSRDNRLHHGDLRRRCGNFCCIYTYRCCAPAPGACADGNKENVDEKGKAPLRAGDIDGTEETDEPEDDDDEEEDDAKDGDAGDMQVRGSSR